MCRAIVFSLVAILVAQQVRAEDVRVKQNTAIRSGPSDDAYSNGQLQAGQTVNVLDWAHGGSRYAKIDAPANAYSLVPADSVEGWFTHHPRPGEKVRLRKPESPLIDGNPSTGVYLPAQGVTIPKSAEVEIIGQKTIVNPVTRKPASYYQIRPHGGEIRFVHADHLEGGPAYSQSNIPSLNSPPSSGIWDKTHPQNAPPPSDLGEIEQLPPAVINDIHAADLAYREAITTRAWEDARQRYNRMTLSPYVSVRILAINRLEFIRQWQLNPQAVLPSRQVAEGVTVGMPQYPPTTSMWNPSDGRPTTPVALTNNVPPKTVTIRPDQPPVATKPQIPPATQLTSIPTYPNSSIPPSYQQQQPAVAATTPVKPATATPPPLANTVKQTGQLHQAAQYDGFNPLYYLTNSQGAATYYVKAMVNTQINLANYVGRYVEVEGTVNDRRSQLGREQINAVNIKELR